MQDFEGGCSEFGGPLDTGVGPDEGLGLLNDEKYLDDPRFSHLFLDEQPEDTTGMARRLNPLALYCAIRWNPGDRQWLLNHKVTLVNPRNGRRIQAQVVDWGPNPREFKGGVCRACDGSPGVLRALGLETNQRIRVEFG
jgi:hypothetical protein